ncbi:hypothetical protein DFH08DRAFT_1082438 [Mycena albidolilacea]|uniref:Uncharacterized protein n=1 Tax=Mycena albidolilacea TaxID=1033008 RepID=A0AAD6ZUF4_9AGAR|nr:hypothetical protein DFH08DRAFT_1082438 [Mycena albidolilacea]
MSQNITVDDQNGDPSNGYQIIYEPKDAWVSNGIGGCPNCTMPNSNRPFMNTWHGSLSNGSVPINASFAFFGRSVTVFCIFANYAPGIIEMTFDIDGVQSGNFSHSPKGTGNDYNFNNVVFASQQLPLKNHSLTIHNGFVGGPTSLVILDSITYTTEDVASASETPIKPSSQGVSSNNSSRTLKMLLAVLLPVLVVACIALLWLFVRRRRLSRRSAACPEKATISESRAVRIHSSMRSTRTSAIRRQYIQQELRVVQEQFVDIDELERMHASSTEDIRSQLDGARERNNQLLTRIHELEAQLESAWALGLSDEPPPGYSARESLT